jgi:hypothetical protein
MVDITDVTKQPGGGTTPGGTVSTPVANALASAPPIGSTRPADGTSKPADGVLGPQPSVPTPPAADGVQGPQPSVPTPPAADGTVQGPSVPAPPAADGNIPGFGVGAGGFESGMWAPNMLPTDPTDLYRLQQGIGTLGGTPTTAAAGAIGAPTVDAGSNLASGIAPLTTDGTIGGTGLDTTLANAIDTGPPT